MSVATATIAETYDRDGFVFPVDIVSEAEAKELCKEAVDGAREVLGADHPTTQGFMQNPWGIR